MKKLTKISCAVVTSALAFVAYKSYKNWKKRKEREEEVESKRKEELDSMGVSVEKLDKEIDIDEDENNLVKGLYVGVRFNPEWDLDIIDVDTCLEKSNIIHLMQFNKGHLSFVFEIPEIKNNTPKIGDYITKFSSTANKLWEDIVKYSPKPKTSLLGYFIVSYKEKDSDETKYGYLRIPESLYSPFADDKHDGLTEYIHRLRTGQEQKSTVLDGVNFGDTGVVEMKAIDVQLFFQIEFPIQTKNSYGINLMSGMKCLRYLTENVTVKGKNGREVEYRNIFFHAPNPIDKEWDFMYYYDTDSNNNVIATDFEF